MAGSDVSGLGSTPAAALQLSVPQWKRLNGLLALALDVEPEQRATWLGTLPDESRDLVPVLQHLLARAAAAGTSGPERLPRLGPSARPPLFHGPATAHSAEAAGAQIGPYCLLRELGVGGMGSVWLAERTDGAFKREVALKMPRAEWTDRGLAERMARERAVLASLNHPNIAQMYEAGWASDGRPYLALEYVDGAPIDAWCTSRALAAAARVRLFVEVVRAVAFAHAKLVIHRDLKPSNVLVTAEGHVKLLDFGIAKLLSAEATLAEETALTRLSGRALTLSYAAPEQILGQPISTAADIYSLGVMLFDLLTGSRPYRPARESRGALEEAIVGADPPLPSSVATNKPAARALRGDLDAIVLKALHKKPEQRYETAAAFADDLERWLDHRPVRAQRSSGWYRMRRFLARHRFRVIAGTVAIFLFLAGSAAVLWQRQVAGEDATRAEMVKAFVLSIIAQADPSATGETNEADLTLLTTTERRLAAELGKHPELALELRLAIAKAYRNRGEFARARETLRQAIDDASKVLPASDPRLARAWIEGAEWHVTERLEIEPELDRAIQTMRELGRDGAELAVEGLWLRARRLNILGRTQEAETDLRESHALAIKYFGEGDPKTLRATLRLLRVQDDDRLLLTKSAYRAALSNADLPRSDPTFLEVQAAHAVVLCEVGRGREGLALLQATVDTARQKHGSGAATQRALGSLSTGLRLTGDVAGGYESLREAQALGAARAPEGSVNRAVTASSMLNAALQARRIEAVAPTLKEARLLKVNEDWIEAMLVWLRNYEGDAVGAAELAPRAIEIATQRGWPFWIKSAKLGWSYALRQMGQPAHAQRILESLAQESEPNAGADFGDVLKERAAVELALGDATQALATVDKAIEGLSKVRLQTDPHLSELQLTRGQALLQLGRADEALAAFRVSDEFWRGYDPKSHWAAEATYWLARALIDSGDRATGRPMLKGARARLAKSPMPSHRALAAAETAPR
jgi:serine/threonine-protein kinase